MNYKRHLNAILEASGWSQERLAHELGVSFATLNAWLRERAIPRSGALTKIERLYLTIVGSQELDIQELEETKLVASKIKLSASQIISSKSLLESLTLYLTYHTNTIEGSTMTLADVEDVLFDSKVLSNRTATEQAEARNHQAALSWLLDEISMNNNLSIDDELIKSIHLRLMNGIVSDAGHFRNHSVRIQGSKTPVANWAKVPELMKGISAEINGDTNDVIFNLAKTHADFEKIHPFSDGNGRTGRLVLLAMA